MVAKVVGVVVAAVNARTLSLLSSGIYSCKLCYHKKDEFGILLNTHNESASFLSLA